MNQSNFKSPKARFGIAAAIVVISFLALGFYLGLAWIAAYLFAINLTTFMFYGYDKFIAGGRATRVPEIVLHGLAFLGGSIGGLLAQKAFRHKTAKKSFQIMYWLIVVLQIGLLVYWYAIR